MAKKAPEAFVYNVALDRVIDGDTFDCIIAAKERLKELCVGKFKIKSLGKGKYGRILGIPYTENGKDICQILINEGHAVEYHGGTKVKIWGAY